MFYLPKLKINHIWLVSLSSIMIRVCHIQVHFFVTLNVLQFDLDYWGVRLNFFKVFEQSFEMGDKIVNLAAVIPEWLNQTFFEKVIRQVEKDANAKVVNFDIKPAMKPGENFASAVFRVSITFSSKFTKQDKTISVILKTKPVLGPEMAAYAEILDKAPFFSNEMALYGKVLPDIQSLLLSARDKDILSPK